MGGFFGVASKEDCVFDLFFGIDYHSHLGTRRGGITVYGKDGFERAIHNIENAPFRTKFEKEIHDMSGWFGIGCISDYEAQPLIIRSHHGTSSTAYFLNQYLNNGGDPEDVDAFYYHGQKPTTKEEVILMVCDTIEAASRTLTEFTPEAFDRFVENMVRGKEKAGQLEDADITLREMNLMKSMLKTYLQNIYHGRVVYPKRKR